MRHLAELLQLDRLTHVVDVGANPIDGEPPYKNMLVAGVCRVTGFEPQQDALNQLLAAKGPNENYLPYAVGDGSSHVLRICRASGMTSLYEPDQKNLSLFEVLQPLGEVLERCPMQTQRLDDIDAVDAFDMLKIDIQGGELGVFQNGRKKLRNAVAIQTEVSFITLYEGQPAFGEIDIELRSQGFIPHCFAAVKKWPIAPCVINGDPRQPLNQLLEADLVYVRDFLSDDTSDAQLRQLAFIAHGCYQSIDLTMRCITELQRRNALSENAMNDYLAHLQAGK